MRITDAADVEDQSESRRVDGAGPRCSIIIAAYNAETYIKKAIYSARAQTEIDIEIIVVDDGSRDATALIAREISLVDPRVIVIGLAVNRGVSAARNAALAVARGTWMAVLDADDEYAPERIAAMLDYAEAHGADMVADNLEMHDFATGAALGRAFPDEWMQAGREIGMEYVLERDIPGIYDREIGFYKPVIRRDLLTRYGIRYDEEIFAAEDFLLYAECLLAGGRMRFMPDALYKYAMRKGSLSSLRSSNESLRQVCKILLRRFAHGYPLEQALLQLRLDATNYELFLWHLKARRMSRAAAVALQLPPGFLLKRLAVFIKRLAGQPAANPTRSDLAAIGRRVEKLQAR